MKTGSPSYLMTIIFIVICRVLINAQVCILYIQKMKRMYSFLARYVPRTQEKRSENFSK